ncbi:MAG: ABC transporter permease [Clostridia bacterium]
MAKTKIMLEKRLTVPTSVKAFVPIIAIFLALVATSIFFIVGGKNPIEMYIEMFGGAFGSWYGISETLVKTIPLLICALGVSVAFRMQLYNTGAEGQLYMGALAATYVALFVPNIPTLLRLPVMMLAALLAGALWAFIPAISKALWDVNEVITTLLLNYVAILTVESLLFGAWKDPNGFNFPQTAQFDQSFRLPAFGTTRIHMGLVIGIVLAVILYIVFSKTKWGYEIRVMGESKRVAVYSGMNISRNIVIVLCLSGALAGLAGMSEVSGVSGRLIRSISDNFGYSAIIVAWLARLNPFMIIVVSFLFGGLLSSGSTIQMAGLPASTSYMLQGTILFFVLAGELFIRYKVRFIKQEVE